LVHKADRRTAWEFLEHLLKAVPYRIHKILTDNGIQFAEQPRNRNTAWSRQMRFDMICEANGIEHRLTKPNHPWTNRQVERMNRTIKEETVKRFHHDNHEQLRVHLADFMAAYNFARQLNTLSGLTPYEYIAKIWTSEPGRFIGLSGHSATADPAINDAHFNKILTQILPGGTPKQRAQLKLIANSVHTDLNAFHAQFRTAHQRTYVLLLQPSIDRAGLEALRVEQVQQADRASRRIVQGLADAAEVLTPSQRVRLAAHLKAVHHKGAGL
jgi:hypothetical protein